MKVQQGNNARGNKGEDLEQTEVRRFIALFSCSSSRKQESTGGSEENSMKGFMRSNF